MSEKYIQQVLEIEKQADAIHDAAVDEAIQLPIKAEQEAQVIIEKARAAAQEEAHQIIESAQSEEESARILTQAEEKVQEAEALAQSNLERAVAHVLDRIMGRE